MGKMARLQLPVRQIIWALLFSIWKLQTGQIQRVINPADGASDSMALTAISTFPVFCSTNHLVPVSGGFRKVEVSDLRYYRTNYANIRRFYRAWR